MAQTTTKECSTINAVLLGGTGVGKSTLINYFYNLYDAGTVENPRIGIPTKYCEANVTQKHNERDTHDTTTSKTASCSIHEFVYRDCKLQIMDTPGINDTFGFEQDDLNVEMIFEAIGELGELHAIILLFNGTHSRLTISIENVIRRFMERIPKDFVEHFILILTNCEEYRVNFDVESFSLEQIHQKNIFYMQNSVFSCNRSQLGPKQQAAVKQEWDESMKTLQLLVEGTLMKMTPIATTAFQMLDDKRSIINEGLQRVLQNTQKLKELKRELESLQSTIELRSKASEEVIQRIEKIMHENSQSIETMETSSMHLICQRCHSICINNCSQKHLSSTGEDMNTEGICSETSTDPCDHCLCPLGFHHHNTKVTRFSTLELQEKLQKQQSQLKDITIEMNGYKEKQIAVKGEIELIEGEMETTFDEVENLCQQLKRISLKYNPVKDLSDTLLAIENDCAELNPSPTYELINNKLKWLKSFCQESKQGASTGKTDQPMLLNNNSRNERYNWSKKQSSNYNNYASDRSDDCYLYSWEMHDLYQYLSTPHRQRFQYYGHYPKELQVRRELEYRMRGEHVGFLDRRELFEFGNYFRRWFGEDESKMKEAIHKIGTDIKRIRKQDKYYENHEHANKKSLELAAIKLLLEQRK